jgi:hypothetical protein
LASENYLQEPYDLGTVLHPNQTHSFHPEIEIDRSNREHARVKEDARIEQRPHLFSVIIWKSGLRNAALDLSSGPPLPMSKSKSERNRAATARV